ncbi:hypothetical protein [Leptospira noguchii]|uniref:Uncharacterized protein n=1 Tax=Leptospira noguchii TaxID=28182 RepID=A0AAE9K9Q4_9LEPT|nr:hypothetical protein [Leptospira noguchii]UOG45729.1 hypothetical protein MAL01_03640 [Leptospira noguchii]UOG57314.1 hypothetical protein MAL03_03855 [Leptospira noguchii]
MSQSTMKFASCDDDPGNSVNAYLWVGVQGVVALSLLFAPIFLRRTHVKLKVSHLLNSGYLKICRNSHQTLILRINPEKVGTPIKL